MVVIARGMAVRYLQWSNWQMEGFAASVASAARESYCSTVK
jgi:hypothetical protein